MKVGTTLISPVSTFSADETLGSPRQERVASPVHQDPDVFQDADVFENVARTNLRQTSNGEVTHSDALRAARMLTDKGAAWNDAETRDLIVRAGWVPKLLEAMEEVPAAQQEAARAQLAKNAVVFLEQNNWLKDDGVNDFVRDNREMIWTLFADKGLELGESKLLGTLELDFPEGYEDQIKACLDACAANQIIVEVDQMVEDFKNEE